MTSKTLLFVWLMIIVLPSAGVAQEDPMRDLLTWDKAPECNVYLYNARLLIPRLHEAGQLDSVDMILEYVDEICSDDFFRGYRTLRDIEAGKSFEDWCDPEVIRDILNTRPFWMQPTWYNYSQRADTSYVGYSFFLSEYSRGLMDQTDENSMAHLLCRYYHGDTEYIFERLSDSAYPDACIQNAYSIRIEELKKRINAKRGHWSVNAGIWNPMGNADLLGPKVELGGELGGRFKRLGVDLTLFLRFLKAQNEYVVRHEGELLTTSHFFGGYIGGSFVYQIVQPGSMGLECFTGIGWDGFDAYQEEDESKTINALNFNIGLTAMLMTNIERTHYVGLQARYNIVNYDTDGGTDLSGNTISLNLVFGYMGNSSASREARRLHYYD